MILSDGLAGGSMGDSSGGRDGRDREGRERERERERLLLSDSKDSHR
jgi:hypothetical protein